ncbi:MAG: cytochrome c-type biosis protein CcmE [Acidobacteriota bacterium]|jgi:cytochrome c-type biogenesis protein CcmE|nr:cytochrome c-type biosis protein CcmE [Acidobacteriota bacterium]
MKSKGYYVVGSILLLAFIGFSLSSFKQTLTPYVSYEEARTANRMVQVAGALEKGSSSYHQDNQSLYFNLKDLKTQQGLRVRYKGVKPGNFEDAISVVAIGHFDAATKEFEANKLLVKCPSKYQGAEVKQYS